VEQAAQAATSKTEGSLRRIAVTENAEAHNTGKAAAARRLPALGLLRVWDAQLDKLTCPICARMDGTIVGIREPFSIGEPGTIHPWDRCTFTILHTSEDPRGTLIQPAPLQVVHDPPPRPPPLPVAPRDPLLAPLPRVARDALQVTRGIAEADLKFLRSGYRPKLQIYGGVPRQSVDAVATGRLNPPGSRQPLPPITIGAYPGEFHLIDGRHRLEAAQNAGATRILAKIRVYGPRGGLKWEGVRDIPLPRPDLKNPHGRQ
jgi:hypothetical protein